MTIQDAWKRILEIRGKKVTCFTVQLWQWGSGAQELKLSLFDGKDSHYAKNLDDIIKLAEISVSEPGVIDGELPETPEKAKEGQADG